MVRTIDPSPGVVELLGGAGVVGVFPGGDSLAEATRAGLPAAAARRLADALNLSAERLAAALDVPAAAVLGPGRLTREQSDRLARLARVADHAMSVFDAAEKAGRWLDGPVPALGGAKPLDLCDTDAGAREVDEILGRIEYGIFS